MSNPQASENHLKQIAGRSALILVFKVIGAISGFAFAYLITQKFGASGYGRFEFAFSCLTIGALLAKAGLDTAVLRLIPEYGQDSAKLVRNARFITFGLGVIASVLLYLGSDAIESFFGLADVRDYLRIAAIALVPLSILQFQAEVLRARHDTMAFAILQPGMVLALCTLLILLPIPFMEIEESSMFGYLAACLILLGFALFRSLKSNGPETDRSGNSPILDSRGLIKLSLPLMISSAMYLVLSWTDTLMTGYFLDEEQIGVYRLVFKISTLITFAQFAINAVAAPVISNLYHRSDFTHLQSYVHRIVNLNLLAAVIIGVMIWLTHDIALSHFGKAFEGQALLLTILCLGQLVNAICGPVMYLLNMTGHERKARDIMIWSALLNIIANAILIPIYGILGAAIATAATMCIWNLWGSWSVKEMLGIRTLPGR